MRREKSQAARPAIAGASILPLKHRMAGRSAAASAPIRTGFGTSILSSVRALIVASPSSSIAWARFSGCWPTRRMPLVGSALAQTRYQVCGRSGWPTETFTLLTSSIMPSGVITSAKPSPLAGSRRETTVCAGSPGRVGQISASTESDAGSFALAAPSISA